MQRVSRARPGQTGSGRVRFSARTRGVRTAATGQDGRETINSEVQLVFRKKTRGQVIGAELQEGFTHIGSAVSEAGRLAAEQLGPRVEAARDAAGPAFEASRKAVAPKVAAAVAAAAPAVASARDTLGPRVEAARDALGPRVEAAREAAAPRVAAAVLAAQAAATKAAADLAPHVESAQKRLTSDVVPRLGAAQTAALAYATPRVAAAREAMTPVLEDALETLSAGVDTARSELEARRAELAAGAAASTRKARKSAKKARKKAGKKRRDLEAQALVTAAHLKRRAGVQPEPRRWPWVFALLALGTAIFVVLRRKKDDWTPAPTGDGPVPSYREDPVPSSPSESGKTVSTATEAPGDSSPGESDMGTRDAQLAEGDGPDTATANGSDAPEPFTSGGGADEGPTAGPADKQA
jgi:hypothetical protein